MAIKIGEKKYQNFQKKYRNNQMVFVKQKKKTMRYKNFLVIISLNLPYELFVEIRADIRINKRAIQMDDSFI
jgi:hypothetical protein